MIVLAPGAGFIAETAAGGEVAAGQRLFALDTSEAEIAVSQLQIAETLLITQRDRISGSLHARRLTLLDKAVTVRMAQVSYAEAHFRDMRDRNSVGDVEYSLVPSAEALILAAQRDVAQARYESIVWRERSDQLRATLGASLALIADKRRVIEADISRAAVAAPRAGSLRWIAPRGGYVSANDPVVEIS